MHAGPPGIVSTPTSLEFSLGRLQQKKEIPFLFYIYFIII